MTDIFDAEKRSEIMSHIKGKDTKPELIVCRHLRRRHIYFKKHYRAKEKIVLDIALPRKKKTVFIDGDFWHGRTLDKIIAKRGDGDFWVKKLSENMARDKRQRKLLVSTGWQVMSVWESDLTRKSTQTDTLARIEEFLA